MKKEDVNLALYRFGMTLLQRSGVFLFLNERSKVRPIVTENYYAERHIAELNRSAGYSAALEDILLFFEKFLKETRKEAPAMDFGAVKKLLEDGEITEGEANDLKSYFATGGR